MSAERNLAAEQEQVNKYIQVQGRAPSTADEWQTIHTAVYGNDLPNDPAIQRAWQAPASPTVDPNASGAQANATATTADGKPLMYQGEDISDSAIQKAKSDYQPWKDPTLFLNAVKQKLYEKTKPQTETLGLGAFSATLGALDPSGVMAGINEKTGQFRKKGALVLQALSTAGDLYSEQATIALNNLNDLEERRNAYETEQKTVEGEMKDLALSIAKTGKPIPEEILNLLPANQRGIYQGMSSLFAENNVDPIKISAGEYLINPSTGEIIFQAPENGSTTKTQVVDVGGRKLLINEQTGATISDLGSSDSPLDQAKLDAEMAKLKADDPANIAMAKSQNILDVISQIDNFGDLNDYTGLLGAIPAVPGSKKANFKSYYDQLRGMLTMENMGLIKGVLSDSDMKMLKEASAALNTNMSAEAFKTELAKIKEKAQKAVDNGKSQISQVNTSVDLKQILTSHPELQATVMDIFKDNPNISDADVAAILGFNNAQSGALNGSSGKIINVKIGNKPLLISDKIARPLSRADNDFFQATGQHLQINSSYRSVAEQRAIRKKFGYTSDSQPSGWHGLPMASPPGKSNHQKGTAVDIGNWKVAEKYLRKYGLFNNISNDKNHFDLA